MREGILIYNGRPQTLIFMSLANYCDILLSGNMAQNGPVTQFYGIMTLVLNSNFDIYTFYLLIYL